MSRDKFKAGVLSQNAVSSEDSIDYIVPLTSIRHISRLSREKRKLLIGEFRKRGRRKKKMQVATGVLSLISGGAASALFLPAMDLVGVKAFAAVVAFASGLISIISHTYFDDKETAKISEAAGAFGELRNRADIFLNSSKRDFDEIDSIFRKLLEHQTTLQEKFDGLIEFEIVEKISAEILTDLKEEAKREIARISASTERRFDDLRADAIANFDDLRPNGASDVD